MRSRMLDLKSRRGIELGLGEVLGEQLSLLGINAILAEYSLEICQNLDVSHPIFRLEEIGWRSP
jgi:hypothetical protein